jgi:hypothetical protein
MDLSDIYINDLLYYRELNKIEQNKKENELFIKTHYPIDKQTKTQTKPKKQVKPYKKKKSPTKTKTFYMIEREVYYD